jgi:hypothetical protein
LLCSLAGLAGMDDAVPSLVRLTRYGSSLTGRGGGSFDKSGISTGCCIGLGVMTPFDLAVYKFRADLNGTRDGRDCNDRVHGKVNILI